MNKRIALIILASLIICGVILGTTWSCGLIQGTFSAMMVASSLEYYTLQSNLFILAILVVNLVYLVKNKEYPGWLTRLNVIGTFCVMITFVIFWTLLAPAYEPSVSFFLGLENLFLHTLCPLGMMVFCLMSTKPGRLRKIDSFLLLAPALLYFVQVNIASLLGARYGEKFNEAEHFPYFFMDYYLEGWKVIINVLGLIAILGLLSTLIVWIDHRRAIKSGQPS
jgi:hypothetical protein